MILIVRRAVVFGVSAVVLAFCALACEREAVGAAKLKGFLCKPGCRSSVCAGSENCKNVGDDCVVDGLSVTAGLGTNKNLCLIETDKECTPTTTSRCTTTYACTCVNSADGLVCQISGNPIGTNDQADCVPPPPPPKGD